MKITVEFDPATHAIVPRNPDDNMRQAAIREQRSMMDLGLTLQGDGPACDVFIAMVDHAPDYPSIAAPAQPTLTDRLQQQCVDWNVYWRAPDAHGVNLTHEQALELLRDALGVEVEIAAPAQPVPRIDTVAIENLDRLTKEAYEGKKEIAAFKQKYDLAAQPVPDTADQAIAAPDIGTAKDAKRELAHIRAHVVDTSNNPHILARIDSVMRYFATAPAQPVPDTDKWKVRAIHAECELGKRWDGGKFVPVPDIHYGDHIGNTTKKVTEGELEREAWKQEVFELCNFCMALGWNMTPAMHQCFLKSTGDRNKYPNPIDALAKAALAAMKGDQP